MISKENNHGIDQTIEDRTFGRFAEAECIVISAFTDRDLELARVFDIMNKQLRSEISSSSYRFAPVWGGFRRSDTGKIIQVQAFIVFNYQRRDSIKSKKQEDCLELKRLAESWCALFDQEFYFYKEEGIAAKGFYTNYLGPVTNTFEELDAIKAADAYFASLQKSLEESNGESITLSYVKGYVATALQPINILSAMGRSSGEVLFMPYAKRWG